MRKILISALVGALTLAVSSELAAFRPPPPAPPAQPAQPNVYNLFLHGRSSDNHCQALTSVNSGVSDHKNYWGGDVSGIGNIRYIGFDGTRNGGAYSWDNCGAVKQLNDAVNIFCKGINRCNIYTHSTGGLVAAYYFSRYGSAGLNVLDIRLMASAAGGSELADLSTTFLGWLGISTLGGQLDRSVSTGGARSWDHNRTGGLVMDTTSGESSDYWGVTGPFLPGKDDGVLANHSLCNVNRVDTVDRSCPGGGGSFQESYGCGFLWLFTCHRTHHRWQNYNTVFVRPGDTHGGAKKHYR
jgi:hypothetical protein